MYNRDICNKKIIQIGKVIYDQSLFEVKVNGRTKKLEPVHALLLDYLIGKHGQIVDRNMLCFEVWKKQFVSDNAINRAIAILRNVLEDDAKEPEFIKTVHKRGYQFLALAVFFEADDKASSQEAPNNSSEIFPLIPKISEQPILPLKQDKANDDIVAGQSSENVPVVHKREIGKLNIYVITAMFVCLLACVIYLTIKEIDTEIKSWVVTQSENNESSVWLVNESNTIRLISINESIVYADVSPNNELLLIVSREENKFCTNLYEADSTSISFEHRLYYSCSAEFSFEKARWENNGTDLAILEREQTTMNFRMKKIREINRLKS